MKVHYERRGFATNSSSDHSIVVIPGGAKDDIHDNEYFGWEHFTLGSKTSKMYYLQALLNVQFDGYQDKKFRKAIIEGLLGEKINGEISDMDHGSTFALPRAWDGESLHMDFLEEFRRYLMRDDVVVLGGNDNGDEHPLLEKASRKFMYGKWEEDMNEEPVARWDHQYKYWTVFDRETGDKVRFSFDDCAYAGRASKPELVDIKITDYCKRGCHYCYQNSTSQGKHADFTRRLYELEEMQVFEVILGGGEPTQHPRFVEWLEFFRSIGIVPNFTTRSLDWLQDASKCNEILELCGTFAYSVTSCKEVRDLFAYYRAHSFRYRKPIIQCVLGTMNLDELRKIIHEASELGFNVTLLEYKRFGRATGSLPPYPFDGWLKVVQESDLYYVGIDTPLARTYEKELLAAGVNEVQFETVDGVASMYIDAVNQTASRTSYENKEKFNLKDLKISEAWEGLQIDGDRK